MKRSMKTVFAGVFAASQMATAVAGTINPMLAKQDVCDRYEILHINGINTDIDAARSNLFELNRVFGNSHNQHLVRFGLAYNTSEGALTDLQQSTRQLMSMYPGSTFREWMTYIMQGVWPNSVVATAAAEVMGTLATFVANVRRPVVDWKTDPDMPRMMSEIAQFHRSGRIVFVGHSQGTIYANIIYDILTVGGYMWPNYTGPAFKIPASRLGLVSVAAAITSVPGGVYITSSNDAVIDAVRKVVPATRPPNITLTYYPAIDSLGHNFRVTYLAQYTGRDAIVKAIGAKLDTLKPQYNDLTNYSGGSWMIWGWAAWNKCQPWQPCSDGRTTGEEIHYSKLPNTVYPSTTVVPNPVLHRAGTYSEMLPLANKHAATCVSTLISNKIARINNGGAEWAAPNVPGCSNPLDSSKESYAWMLYSTDGMIIKPAPNVPPAPESYGWSEARVYAYPYCKPPTL